MQDTRSRPPQGLPYGWTGRRTNTLKAAPTQSIVMTNTQNILVPSFGFEVCPRWLRCQLSQKVSIYLFGDGIDEIGIFSHFVFMTAYSTTATIGELIDYQYHLTAHCACGRHADIDLEKLAEKLGREHGAMAKDLLPKMKCSGCKSRFSAITISPKNTRGT